MSLSADQLAAQLGARPSRPRCRGVGCTTALDGGLVDHEDNTGLHYGCEEPGEQPVGGDANAFLMQGVSPGAPAPYCGDCDHDTHRCPGCGVDVPHGGTGVCQECTHRLAREAKRCQECATEDPAPWCDCRDDERCKGPCRRRAHHPGSCPPPPGPPPSTVDELAQVLIGYDASRPRSMQTRLGPSELGTPCQQQIARKLAGAPRRPATVPAWAPFQGTAVHAEMEKVVAYWNEQLGRVRWLAEDELRIDEEIRGHGDAYDLDSNMVVDWKHVGTTALKKLRTARRAGKSSAEQVSPEYRVQAHLYGVGHERKDRTVRFVRLVLLARSWEFSDSDEWTEEYQPDIAFAALDRYYATYDLLKLFDVINNPDRIIFIQATPSNDTCKWCPFYRPGQPSNWHGCAGDVERSERAIGRQLDGLIVP